MKKSHLLALSSCLITLVLSAPAAQGKALLLDFGPTVTQPAFATNDPAHFIGVVPPSETIWNSVSRDTNTLYYSDGTSATGVTLELGRSTAGSDLINFADNGFTVNALGNSLNGGVYAGSSPVKDGIFGGSGGANNLALGVRVNGLPAGTYTLYVHGRNSNTALPAPLMFYAKAGPGEETYAFSLSDATAPVSNTSPAITNAFVQGNNFGVLTVTVADGESLYLASEGTLATEMRGFLNAVTVYFGVPEVAAQITDQPAGKSVYEGVTVILKASAFGNPLPSYQWYFNSTNALSDGPDIGGSTTDTLVLRRVSLADSGDYSIEVTNSLGWDISSNATLSVASPLNTAQATNIWSLVPGEHPWLGIGSTERSLAYNPVSGNLLVVSRAAIDPSIIVLDSAAGVQKHAMDVTGIPASAPNSTVGLSTIGVAEDGVVFGANVTVAASTAGLNIYGWPDDSSAYGPSPVFLGDPAAGVEPNLRWGDNFAIRGAGPGTQILMAPSSGTNVALFRTTSGQNFQTEIPPAIIAVSGVPSGFARWGIAFGPGANTFWAKTGGGGALYLIQFDVDAGTGFVLHSFPIPIVPSSMRGIAVDPSGKFLGGVTSETMGDSFRLYDISDLARGPVLLDQEVFETQNSIAHGAASVAFGPNRAFALDENNGIKAFTIDPGYIPPPISFMTQPTDRTAMEGATVTFTSMVAGLEPLTMQWKFNGTNDLVDDADISGAKTNVLTLRNITMASAGQYALHVTNPYGDGTSSNAVLTVLPTFNTAQMTNIWTLQPFERSYFGANNSERGLAYNSATSNLLVVSRATLDPAVVVLDALTGAEKHFLDVTGIPTSVAGVTLGLNTIGAADDGVIFGASVAVNAANNSFFVYRWPSDQPGVPPTQVFGGDPAAAVQPGLRWTDAIAVRGTGAGTQILLTSAGTTNVVILRTSSGTDFQNEIPPAVISVSGVSAGFGRLGVAFGPGTNTFWAQSPGTPLYLIEFNLDTKTGTVLREYPANAVGSTLRAISANASFLAGIALDINYNVRLFDISDLESGPVLRDQELFPTTYLNNVSGGTGATAFGGHYLFALDTNNGLRAFRIDPDYIPPVTTFSVTGVSQIGGSIVLTWQSSPGNTYQVVFRDSLTTGDWQDLGSPVTATAATTSFTNQIQGPATFFRVRTP